MSNWQILSVQCDGILPTPLPKLAAATLLVFPANSVGEELAGRYSAQTGAVALGRITGLTVDGGDLIATRSSHGGHLSLELRVAPGLAVATSLESQFCTGSLSLGAPDPRLLLTFGPLPDQGGNLGSARIVIGGGRGLDEVCFAHLDNIARQLGGAVGASLPAVDLGLAPVSRQVGQSGRFVNPEIYFAVGMSGTPQHFAGVGARARIIALNSDREAPIFKFAEAGIAGDAATFLPLLTDALSALEGQSK